MIIAIYFEKLVQLLCRSQTDHLTLDEVKQEPICVTNMIIQQFIMYTFC
jgi:hypothetical protein